MSAFKFVEKNDSLMILLFFEFRLQDDETENKHLVNIKLPLRSIVINYLFKTTYVFAI